MTIPYASSDAVFRSFKVMPRAEVRPEVIKPSKLTANYSVIDFLFMTEHANLIVYKICTHKTFLFVQNAHAYVNAGFYMEVDTTNYTVKGKPSLVFGGISTHGVSTQTYLLFVLEPGFLFWILTRFCQKL